MKQLIEVYKPCGLDDLRTAGFASSVPYRQAITEDNGVCSPECRNLRLANRRAEAVKTFVEGEFKVTVTSDFWREHAEMIAARRLLDMEHGQINAEGESLNRRAEISWTTAGCR